MWALVPPAPEQTDLQEAFGPYSQLTGTSPLFTLSGCSAAVLV